MFCGLADCAARFGTSEDITRHSYAQRVMVVDGVFAPIYSLSSRHPMRNRLASVDFGLFCFCFFVFFTVPNTNAST